MLENLCCFFEKESEKGAVLGVCKGEVGEASRANLFIEKGCVEVNAPLCEKAGLLEWGNRDDRVREEENKFVGFAVVKSGSHREKAEGELVEVVDRGRTRRKKGGENWNRASAFEDVDGLLCAKEKGALVVVGRLLVRKRDVTGAQY